MNNGPTARQRKAASPDAILSSTDDEGAGAVPPLPLARENTSSLNSPIAILFALQVLGAFPAAMGFVICARKVLFGLEVEEGSTRLEYLLAGLWSIYSGYSSFSLAAGLTRRWLVFYDFGAAIIRLFGLQAFVWPLTHFTVAVVLPGFPLLAWIICALSAALCNNISIWATSNIRLHRAITQRQKRLVAPWAANVPYLRQSASRASTRTMDWAKVVRRTVLPLLVLSHVTLWALLGQMYSRRSDFPPPLIRRLIGTT